MVFLLELKEGFKKFYNKYDTYLVPAVRFVMALVSFLMLNASIGYMSKLKNPLIAVAMAVLCAFLPNGFMIFFLSVFMLVHLYAISAEFALIVLGIVLLMYLLYYRFTPKQGYLLVITVLLCWIKMPYLLPIAAGLCFNAFAMIPAAFGVIIFYIIKTASEYETALTTKSVNDSMQQISYIVESLFNNKEMILFVIAMVVTITAVYAVRRLKIDNDLCHCGRDCGTVYRTACRNFSDRCQNQSDSDDCGNRAWRGCRVSVPDFVFQCGLFQNGICTV